MLVTVANPEEPTGVVGRRHADLLLSFCGIWRSHIFLQLQ